MNDPISRQAAIKAVHDEFDECLVWDESGECTANEVERVLDGLPTIDPVKHGKWIADKYTRKCTECGSTYWMREGNEWNYCPNCGSKNGGEG